MNGLVAKSGEYPMRSKPEGSNQELKVGDLPLDHQLVESTLEGYEWIRAQLNKQRDELIKTSRPSSPTSLVQTHLSGALVRVATPT